MTFNKLLELQKYLKNNVGCDVKIGDVDLGSRELPCILLIPDENGLIDTVQNIKTNTYQFNIKIQINDSKEPERLIKTLKIFDDFIREINNFKREEGHILKTDYTTEYTDNNYRITFVYILKFQN